MADHRRSTLFLLTFLLYLWIEPGESQIFWDQCDDICPAVYYTSTYDLPCIDACETHGYSYYYCQTKKGWDYCSPGVDIDYNGNKCDSSHPCGKYLNLNVYKCLSPTSRNLVECGRVEPMAMHYKTIYLKECISQCQYYESGGYFWCFTADSWDYCSPRPDITYKNVACRSNHPCGTYGQTTYSWCYTTYSKDWDYCGLITPGECSYTGSSRRKRQPNISKVTCNSRTDQNTGIVTLFIVSPGTVPMADISKKLRTEAEELIKNKFKGQGLSEQARSNLVRSANFRIDNQGMVNVDNQRYYNLQVQRNIPRTPGQSTTVANILAPVDASPDYMRLGLRESLARQVKIVLEEKKNEPGPSTSGGSKKCCKRRNR